MSPVDQVENRKSLVHSMTLALVWLTVAMSAVVFSEPAPFDVSMMGLIVLLPITGLVRFNPITLGFMAVWLIIGVAGYLSATLGNDLILSTKHITITLYLSIASAVLIGFVAKNPRPHANLMMSAYLVSAVIASLAAIIGYFNILPGFEDLFTLYGRARGTFKDPNVFGAFIVPAFVYGVHLWLNRPMSRTLLPSISLALLTLGVLLSFSRGAWAILIIALAIYMYLIFVTTNRDSVRLKLGLVTIFGGISFFLLIAIALQFDAISGILLERASLDQSYDQGPQGRFGGQLKALEIILTNPFGIGALTFGNVYHHEETHNVYLSMFLNGGWISGFSYFGIVLMSIVLGFRHAFRKNETQGVFTVILAAFIATALEGWIVDTDHWRHFFVLLALLWGLMIAEHHAPRRQKPKHPQLPKPQSPIMSPTNRRPQSGIVNQ